MEQAPTADDAAERFYRRNFEAWSALDLDGFAAAETIPHGNHRYSSAWSHLKADRPSRVLEMGYGSNAVIPVLAPLVGEYHIVDIVDRTRGVELPANVTPHVANLDHPFPFPAASFDAVIAMMVIEHMYDPFHAFSEVARVARPGAQVFVNLPNIASIKCRLQLLTGRMPVTSTSDWFAAREWDGGHLHYFTVADVRRIADLFGLDLLESNPVGRFARLKRLWPTLLCHEITYRFARRA